MEAREQLGGGGVLGVGCECLNADGGDGCGRHHGCGGHPHHRLGGVAVGVEVRGGRGVVLGGAGGRYRWVGDHRVWIGLWMLLLLVLVLWVLGLLRRLRDCGAGAYGTSR